MGWHWTRINNGVLEGINSLVQASKRRARSYRNNKNLIAMIYLIGKTPAFSRDVRFIQGDHEGDQGRRGSRA